MSNANVSVYLSEFPMSNKLSTPIFTLSYSFRIYICNALDTYLDFSSVSTQQVKSEWIRVRIVSIIYLPEAKKKI